MININEIQIKSGKEVTMEMIEEALDLDWETYKDEYHITAKQGKDYLEKNPYIYFVALYKNKLVGYINFSPITKEMYEKIRSGEFIDTIIEKDDMLTYKDNETYNNYFSSIVVNKDYQRYGIANKLLDALKQFIVDIEDKRGIKINKIIADVISDGGMKIVSKLGLKVLKNSNHNSKIAEWEKEYEK